MNHAVKKDERSLDNSDGELAAMPLSVRSFVRALPPPPDWLKESWESAKRSGLDKMTSDEIDAEIAAARHAKRNQIQKTSK